MIVRSAPPSSRPEAESVRRSAPPNQLKRRGLFAAAWAAAAGFMLKATTAPVSGADGDPVLVGRSSNSATTETWVTSSGTGRALFGYSPGTSGLCGVQGWCNSASGYGVYGNSENNNGASSGVRGTNNSSAGNGVHGSVFSGTGQTAGVRGEAYSPSGFGVLGRSLQGSSFGTGIGVRGESGGGIGVYGVIPEVSAASATAVYGLNYSTYTGGSPGAGGFGVYGLSAKGHGLVGATAAAGAAALVGATNGVAGAYAGAFYGPVIVGGDFTVFGAKSAAVPHPDGSHRRLYCVESPESWFEDFGDATLVDGVAEVTIDPDFAAVVDGSKYQVFLTEYDDHHALYVTERTACGFRVRSKSGAPSGTFGWRLVARRRDIAGERFATVTAPPEPKLPAPPVSMPAASDTPARPWATPTRA
jgi:hypothetical protein